MDKIDRAMLLKMMDDDQDQETQNQAVDLAKKDENIEFWIQPDGYKYSWDNCARVIIEKNHINYDNCNVDVFNNSM